MSETGQSSTTEPVPTGEQPGAQQASSVQAMDATPVKKTKSSTKKTPKKVVPMADKPLACEFGSLQVNGIRYSTSHRLVCMWCGVEGWGVGGMGWEAWMRIG